MKHKNIILAFVVILTLNLPTQAQEASGDLSLEGNIRSKDHVLAEKVVRIYATVKNNSGEDLLGTVKFYDEIKGVFIGVDQPVSVVGGQTDDVFVDWNPGPTGTKNISARIIPWNLEGDNKANNKISTKIYVDIDSDGDGLPNQKDPDDDNDETKDAEDAFPLDPDESADSDEDGMGNNEDTDDDNDGVMDIQDLFPTDPKEALDKDEDGVGDNQDKFPEDSSEAIDEDEDGMGANSDPNDHNKGPVALIKTTTLNVRAKEIMEFDASGSKDPDGRIERYEWLFGTEKVEGVKVEKEFPTPGHQQVTLTVTDDKGESRQQTILINITAQWKRPLIIGIGIGILGLIVGFLAHRRGKKKKTLSEKTK